MTARNGSAEWHGGGESGSTTVTLGDGVSEWWTLVTVCVGTFMLLLDVTIVNVALPKIQPGLGSSFTASCRRSVSWRIAAPEVTGIASRHGPC